MHKLFSVPELVEAIVEQSVERVRADAFWDYSLALVTCNITITSWETLKALNSTSKLFRNPCLNAIWQHQTSLVPLLRSANVVSEQIETHKRIFVSIRPCCILLEHPITLLICTEMCSAPYSGRHAQDCVLFLPNNVIICFPIPAPPRTNEPPPLSQTSSARSLILSSAPHIMALRRNQRPRDSIRIAHRRDSPHACERPKINSRASASTANVTFIVHEITLSQV